MSSGFTNTFILEANRLSSEEVKSGNLDNPALFTNKVNNGLKLNTGDVVGVHSAYISELGAEGSDIEIKGVNIDTLNASQILSYNETTNAGFEGSTANETVLLTPNHRLFNRFPLSRRVDVNERINYRDDEINMVMSPYKNANGEYYITLPYRYGMEISLSFADQIKQWERPYPIIGLPQPLPIPYSPSDSASRTFGNASSGNITRFPNDQYNLKDFRQYHPQPKTLPDPPDPEGTKNSSLTRNIQHDNSRYSIYELENCVQLFPLTEFFATVPVVDQEYLTLRNNALDGIPWDEEAGVHISNASYQHGLTKDEKYGNSYWRDMATRKYVRVKNKVNCSVTAGYNTNQDIANKISEDMLRTEKINTEVVFDYQGNDNTALTVTAENQVNKLYNCATIGNFSEQNWKSFNDVAGKQTAGDDEIFHYIEACKTIGVKRPDLYELGREFATKSEGYKTRFDFYTENAPTNSSNACGLLYTDIPWSKVGDLKKLVDAQHRYPELFDTTQMADPFLESTAFLQPKAPVGSAGFLHINRRADHAFLGYDMSDNNASYWGLITDLNYGDCPTNEFCSVPIFFDINASTRDTPEGIVATGSDWEHAVYGFAVKTKGFGVEEEMVGLRVSGAYNFGHYLDAADNNYIPQFTRIGWDYHFLAYGCPCLLLWNGMCGFDGMGYQGYGVSQFPFVDSVFGVNGMERAPDYVNKIYLGSPDIEMEFDNESDRFQILRLHRSEVIGNLHDAGYEADDLYSETDASGNIVFTNPDDTAVPKNDNAAVKVYKLNKQLNKTNFTPSMAPYFNQVNASFFTRYTDTNNACYTAKQIVEFTNNNFTPQAIFDSQCGNYIVDWGMNEKYWDDSLWGIMGFRYSQTSGSGNTQTRIINSVSWGDVVDGMDENTTNADITNADFDSMTRNLFNVETYGLTPPIPQIPRFQNYNNSSNTFAPPISITQTKGQPLRALEIPTRTLRPYYTIRSNIIGQSNYFGGSDSSIPLPVVAVVEKVSQSGDFFNLSQGRLQFTITQPTMLTDITTSIHDPDGSYSIVSPNSAILYQVQRQVNADMNVVSTILQGDNKKQAQQFEEELDPPQPTKQDITNVINQMVQ